MKNYTEKRLSEFDKLMDKLWDRYGESYEVYNPKEFTGEIKSFLATSIIEGAHFGVNNFETWKKQYHEDKDFVGSFGDWIDQLLTSTQVEEGQNERQ